MSVDDGLDAKAELTLEDKQKEVTTRLVSIPSSDLPEASKLLFGGGQCVQRSLLSVGSTEHPLQTELKDVKNIANFAYGIRNVDDVLDLEEKMESTNMLDDYVMSAYYNPSEAPGAKELKTLIDQENTQVCISLRASQTKPDGTTEYSWHMAHVTDLQIDENNKVVRASSRSDTDEGEKVRRALEAGEKYDVYVFSKKTPQNLS